MTIAIDKYDLQELSNQILLAGIKSGTMNIAEKDIDVWTKYIVALAKSLMVEVEHA